MWIPPAQIEIPLGQRLSLTELPRKFGVVLPSLPPEGEDVSCQECQPHRNGLGSVGARSVTQLWLMRVSDVSCLK